MYASEGDFEARLGAPSRNCVKVRYLRQCDAAIFAVRKMADLWPSSESTCERIAFPLPRHRIPTRCAPGFVSGILLNLKRIFDGRSSLFWLAAGFIALAGLIGGGARGDIISLVILRPVAVLLCGYAFWRLEREQLLHYRGLLILIGGALALTALHLVPLPPAVWQALAGREIVQEIDRVADLGNAWRPLSMAPQATWNALWSFTVPLAVLLLAIQLPANERMALVFVFLAFGAFDGLVTLLQAIAPTNRALYPYRVTNGGLPVGLFANRNHNAFYLAAMLPMLAVASAASVGPRFGKIAPWLALAAGAVLAALVLVVGSRAGGLVLLMALLSVPFLYRPVRSKRRGSANSAWFRSVRFKISAAVGGLLLIVGGLAVSSSRAVALQRLLNGSDGDSRLYLWRAVLDAVGTYFPFGSGAGSFVEAFKVVEPQTSLAQTYANHAHNDWLEVAMTAGLPGMLLLAVGVIGWFAGSWRAWSASASKSAGHGPARLGSVVLLLLALFSLVDYPARVPFIACLAVVAAIWLHGDRHEQVLAAEQDAHKGSGV